MGDFLLDFRNKEERNINKASQLMKFYDDITIDVFECDEFALISSRLSEFPMWSPCFSTDGKVIVTIVGRIAVEKEDWEKVEYYDGKGGQACKLILNLYRESGLDALSKLNGNFIVLIYDKNIKKIHIATDRCGMMLCFSAHSHNGKHVYCSHPDILSEMMNMNNAFDMLSMAEFLITGRVSFPYTYYRGINGLDYGSLYSIDINKGVHEKNRIKKYFDFQFQVDEKISENELAEELSIAFKKAINRRVFSLFGQTAISLSGGLDSRCLLCSANNKEDLWAICFFDEKNQEFDIAKKIAAQVGVKFIPLKRDFDHYGKNAEMGIRISGGMGSLGNNHFLGFRETLKKEGINNLISGFYCDYLFKGLVLDHNVNKITRREAISGFRYQNYKPYFWLDTHYSENVRERLDILFPKDLRNDSSNIGKLEISHRRIFPLYYEPDNLETTIPQRVMGWYLPIVDNDILDVYQKASPLFRLNTSFFSKMVALQCGREISEIININTGNKVNASKMSLILSSYKKSIRSKIKQTFKEGIATNESWPNWKYYMNNSSVISELWQKKSLLANEIVFSLTDKNFFNNNVNFHIDVNHKFLMRILTLKIWLGQRDK